MDFTSDDVFDRRWIREDFYNVLRRPALLHCSYLLLHSLFHRRRLLMILEGYVSDGGAGGSLMSGHEPQFRAWIVADESLACRPRPYVP